MDRQPTSPRTPVAEPARTPTGMRGPAAFVPNEKYRPFQPIRLAVTGSNISPGLFESLELLGRDESLSRLAAAAGS